MAKKKENKSQQSSQNFNESQELQNDFPNQGQACRKNKGAQNYGPSQTQWCAGKESE